MIRAGRPGLLGTVARTAVISGTATAVSGRVQRRQARRDYEQQAQQQPVRQQADPAQQVPAPDRIEQLQQLADLQAQGVLTPEEFAAEKARILGS
ncbi:putative oligomerization/nucleic acid binding protein [Actinocorallia herbida]|uniref:Putative oligomerization/nucleic acid binding protein n=1 Tax=Actinocorallia herbida TaxID=58109 RepID=A0A3N1D937_9ACTN|nr:SHOCT domain-containing protein [Actinocorallia herbida]ROO90011.1 putative oligomerization/nucleic acid binding protein [Actinocorallia herbida]